MLMTLDRFRTLLLNSIQSAALCTLTALLALAQTGPLETRPQRGFLPEGAAAVSGIDSISTVNGSLFLTLPLASLPPGRAGHGFGVDLMYNSQIYDINFGRRIPPGQTQEVLTQELVPAKTGGWKYNFENIGLELEIRQNLTGSWSCLTDGVEAIRLYRLRVGLGDGSQHILHLRGYGDEIGDGYYGDGFYGIGPDGRRSVCATQSSSYPANLTGRLTYYTTDGTFLKLEIDASVGTDTWWDKTWTLYYPDGRRITGRTDTVEAIYDANGNKVEFQRTCRKGDPNCTAPELNITDDVGRSINVTFLTNSDEITSANGAAKWTVRYKFVTVSNLFYECGGLNLTCDLTSSQRAVDQLTLPSTPVTYYGFDYSDNVDGGWGELDFLRTPFRAEVTYRYTQERTSKTLSTLLKNSVKWKSVTHDGETDPPSTYQFNNSDSTITNPDGGVVSTFFYNPDVLSDWKRGLVYKTVQPHGDTVERTWERNKAYGLRNSSGNPNNPYIFREITGIANNGLLVKSAATEFDYDKNGNLREKREYPYITYGSATSPSVLRRTIVSYYVAVPANSTSSTPDDVNSYWRPHNPAVWPVSDTARRLDATKRHETRYSSSTTQAVSEFDYDDPYRNGNVEKHKRWDSEKQASVPTAGTLSASNSVILSRDYDGYGNLIRIDAPEVPTTLTYGQVCNSQSNLYPTQIQSAPGAAQQRTTAISYDCSSAMWFKKRETDSDNNVWVEYGFDPLGRPTSIVEGAAANGLRERSFVYDDENRAVTRFSDLRTRADKAFQTKTYYDQLGRIVKGESTHDSNTLVITDKRYALAGSGRVELESNPYLLSEGISGWNCREYDRNGRIQWIATFSGSTAPGSCEDTVNRTALRQISYEGDVTRRTDAAGNAWKETRDALGRLTYVVEPNGKAVTYGYDSLDNLLTVSHYQKRTFTYSSLSRLITADNPETGVTQYAYEDHGGLKTKTDARGIITRIEYDVLNRVFRKSYSGEPQQQQTPEVLVSYYVGEPPQAGRLKAASNATSSTTYTYNNLGQVATTTQAISGRAPIEMAYTYALNNELSSMTLPSGAKLTYMLNGGGRHQDVRKEGSAIAYATVTSYAAHGAMKDVTLGNGLLEERRFNSLLQMDKVKLSRPGASDSVLDAEWTYPPANNGSPSYQTITGSGIHVTQSYTYDNLDRLQEWKEGTPSRTWSYDQWGNGLISAWQGLAPSTFMPTSYDSMKNRMTSSGAVYDAGGNLTNLGGFTYTYDAENRMTSSTVNSNTTGYSYDGEGRRVKKTRPGGATTYYAYDAQGNVAAEYDSAGGGETRYITSDQLGSTRAVTDGTGNAIARYDYLPFGERIPAGINGRTALWSTDGTSQQFTGKERDTETASSAGEGLDYFGARYMSAAQGRFTSPDPLPGWQKDPQSWNMYAYGRNNPLKYVDPDGQAYRVCQVDDKGKESNCGTVDSDKAFEDYAKAQGWTIKGGNLVNKSGNTVGTAHWLDNESMQALITGTQTAEVLIKDAAKQMAVNAVAGAVVGPLASKLVPALENLPLLRQVSRVVSNNTVKHLINRGHLAEFQKLVPGMTVDGVIQLGIDVAETGSQVAGNAFVKTVQIGGQEVTVRTVLNPYNAIRSVHILQ